MTAEPVAPDSTNGPADLAGPPPLFRRTSGRFVPLRVKILGLLIFTILGLFVALYIPLRLLVLGSYLDLEAQTTRSEVQRAREALQIAITKLNDSTTGYATWDDTYAFVQGENATYMEDNLADPSFPGEDINLAMIVGSNGTVVGAKAYDFYQQRSVPVPAFFLQPELLNGLLFVHTDTTSSLEGVLILPEGPMLVASRPILTSDGQGPVRGTMVMGRFLDEGLVDRLAEATNLTLHFYRSDDPQAPADVRELPPVGQTTTMPISEQAIIGVTQIPDLFGNPGLVLRTESPRQIYAQGVATVTYFTIALAVVAAASLLASLLGLERLVLARVARLDARAHAIGESGDISLRMETLGNDELSRLSQSINGMLAALEHAEMTRREAEEARAHTQEELLRSREQFSQMLVHDLKNPLMGIKGYIDLLNRTPLDASQHELVEGIHRSAANTLGLVTQLLDIARLSEGRLELRRSEVEIEVLLEECARELQPWADLEDKPVAVIVASGFPTLKVDVSLLRRVLVNLTSNAIKHTPYATEITLGAEVADGQARIFVHDTGTGIDPQVKQRLFERFAAAANSEFTSHSTGLGLAFCKLAVEAHDGTISVASEPETGTTFTIALPLSSPTAPSLAPISRSNVIA